MSTRSAIAVKTASGWWGVYHHYDGYPTGLGARLWELLRTRYYWDMEALVDDVVRAHPGGWSHLMEGYILEPIPGGQGLKPNIIGRGPACYCHTYAAASYPDGTLVGCDCGGDTDNPSCNPLFIEWVYVFDPPSNRIEILASVKRSRGWEHVPVAVVAVIDRGGGDKESVTVVFGPDGRIHTTVVSSDPPWKVVENAMWFYEDGR